MNELPPARHGLLRTLRALTPERPLHFSESLRIAELQANRLRELSGLFDGAVPVDLVDQLDRITVRYQRIPTSGLTYWDGHTWVIGINRSEPIARQRFTLFHELKHIIDHGRADRLYTAQIDDDRARQAERAADYFAGCVLMPKRLVRRSWYRGTQRASALAAEFEVSERAMEVRLSQLGLSEPKVRCERLGTKHLGPESRSHAKYERALSLCSNPMEVAA